MKGWHYHSIEHSLAARGIESKESNIEFYKRIMREEKERKARDEFRRDRRRRAVQILKQIRSYRERTKELIDEFYEIFSDDKVFSDTDRCKFEEKYQVRKMLENKI